MPRQLNLEPTGNVIVDALKQLQQSTGRIDSDDKLAYVTEKMKTFGAQTLLGGMFYISSDLVLGKDPGARRNDRILYGDMSFIAELGSFGCLSLGGATAFDVVDGLSLNFSNPEVIGVVNQLDRRHITGSLTAGQQDEQSARTNEQMHQLTLQVPVLAIEACLSA
jgi:hypothetical protein